MAPINKVNDVAVTAGKQFDSANELDILLGMAQKIDVPKIDLASAITKSDNLAKSTEAARRAAQKIAAEKEAAKKLAAKKMIEKQEFNRAYAGGLLRTIDNHQMVGKMGKVEKELVKALQEKLIIKQGNAFTKVDVTDAQIAQIHKGIQDATTKTNVINKILKKLGRKNKKQPAAVDVILGEPTGFRKVAPEPFKPFSITQPFSIETLEAAPYENIDAETLNQEMKIVFEMVENEELTTNEALIFFHELIREAEILNLELDQEFIQAVNEMKKNIYTIRENSEKLENYEVLASDLIAPENTTQNTIQKTSYVWYIGVAIVVLLIIAAVFFFSA